MQQFTEFYVSEEIPVDLNRAIEIINSMSKECDFLVMVISREYIEALPDYILKSLGAQGKTETHLGRGEVLILDYDKKDVVYLR